jgi:hypothetical protein
MGIDPTDAKADGQFNPLPVNHRLGYSNTFALAIRRARNGWTMSAGEAGPLAAYIDAATPVLDAVKHLMDTYRALALLDDPETNIEKATVALETAYNTFVEKNGAH